MAKGGKNSGVNKEMKCSAELQEITKEKKMSRGAIMQALWKYIKKKDLQSSKDKRIVKVDQDDKLMAIFKKAVRKDRTLKMRGKKIEVPAGRIFMTEIGGALQEHLS